MLSLLINCCLYYVSLTIVPLKILSEAAFRSQASSGPPRRLGIL